MDLWAGDTLQLRIDAQGAVGGRKIRKVYLVDTDGRVVRPYLDLATGASTSFTLSPTLSATDLAAMPRTSFGETCLYLKVILDGSVGDVNVLSAPIWLRLQAGQWTVMRMSDATGIAGRPFLLSARLTNRAGAGVANKPVVFFLDGTSLDIAMTAADGTAQRTITLPSGLALGEHRLEARFAGDTSAGAAWDVAILQSSIEATPIVVNGPAVSGNVASGGANWFRFTLTDPAPVTLATMAGTLTDSVMTLYGLDSLTRQVDENDDNSGGQMARIEKTLAPGTYYARVHGYGTDNTGTYTIRATSGLQVMPLVVNAPPTAVTISATGEERWFSFTLTNTGPCTINTAAGTLTDSLLYLYGPNSLTVLLEEDDDDGDGNMARIVRRLSPGKYFVRARAYGSGTGTSSIGVSAPVPGLATHLVFRTQPALVGPAYVQEALNTQPQVEARDGNDALATGHSGSATLTLGGGASGARLIGAATATFVNGVARFSGLAVDRAGSSYRLTASGAGLAPVTSASFDVTGYAFQVSDIPEALRWASGMRALPTTALVRYDIVRTGPSAGRIDSADVVRIARKAAGLEANP